MNAVQLRDAMQELLPEISQEALSAWEAFIEDMTFGELHGADKMRGELYAEMLLIQEDYGDELATALFNMGERHPVNTFELPGAAELMECGMDEESVFHEITSCGWHPSGAHQERVQLILRNLV